METSGTATVPDLAATLAALGARAQALAPEVEAWLTAVHAAEAQLDELSSEQRAACDWAAFDAALPDLLRSLTY